VGRWKDKDDNDYDDDDDNNECSRASHWAKSSMKFTLFNPQNKLRCVYDCFTGEETGTGRLRCQSHGLLLTTAGYSQAGLSEIGASTILGLQWVFGEAWLAFASPSRWSAPGHLHRGPCTWGPLSLATFLHWKWLVAPPELRNSWTPWLALALFLFRTS
jgi:hypothetical protein